MCETVSLVLEPMSAQPPVPPDDVAERYCHLIMVESLDFGHVSKTDASRPTAVNTTATGTAIGVAVTSLAGAEMASHKAFPVRNRREAPCWLHGQAGIVCWEDFGAARSRKAWCLQTVPKSKSCLVLICKREAGSASVLVQHCD